MCVCLCVCVCVCVCVCECVFALVRVSVRVRVPMQQVCPYRPTASLCMGGSLGGLAAGQCSQVFSSALVPSKTFVCACVCVCVRVFPSLSILTAGDFKPVWGSSIQLKRAG